jgi:anti-sigma regulatory factor (Ser/Thr protein kinase)
VSGFQHAALLYDGDDGFVAGTLPFVRAAVEAGEPAMVAVTPARSALLADALGDAAAAVSWVDMEELGRNPGRIIPAWHDFLDRHDGDGRGVRGVGEPIWAGRGAEELRECQLHEALLNVAFADADGFELLCPYDRAALAESVVHEACCTHPAVVDGADREASSTYRDADLLAPFDAPLPPPNGVSELFAFDRATLLDVRDAVGARARGSGMAPERADDLVLAVSEAAANSVRHGGGNGILRMWEQDDEQVCEVRDRGRVADPLVGRRTPARDGKGGWGLYLAHQVCDLVQLRSGVDGTVVRLHMRLAAA